jgi:hypothetical protein
MSADDVDIEARALARIAGSLRSSDRFCAYIEALASEFAEVKDGIRTLDSLMDVDNIGGVNLDVIGEIVVLRRKILGAAPKEFFGFREEGGITFLHAKPYGDRANSVAGGVFYNRGDSLEDPALMGDGVYRFALKAKMIKNTTKLTGEKAWVEKIYDVLFLIFYDHTGSYPIWIREGGMVIEIGIGTIPMLRQVALAFADLLPIPMGVSVGFTVWDDALPVFNFADADTAHGAPYGDRAFPSRGGVFAERMNRNVPG